MHSAIFIFVSSSISLSAAGDKENVRLSMLSKSDSGLPSTDRAGFYSKLGKVAKE